MEVSIVTACIQLYTIYAVLLVSEIFQLVSFIFADIRDGTILNIIVERQYSTRQYWYL